MKFRLLVATASVAAVLVFVGAPRADSLSVAPGRAVELGAPVPGWYTPDLHARVVAAAGDGLGVPLPAGVEVPASALAFTGIRPGAWMLFPAGCTLNFVFGSGSDLYIGTAGHCSNNGDEVTIVAAPGVLMNIGTTVKSVNKDIGEDFGLIAIRPSMVQYVNPSMAYFGGPTSRGNATVGDVVLHAGHGLVIGTGGTPRAGVVTFRGEGEVAGSDAVGWIGAATPGDSGSPVLLANGRAAGNLTHVVVGGKYLPSTTAGTSIARMLQIAGKPLATAPLLPDPLF